ncbi:MAG: FtsX-like permease family protein, partial [Anaerolineales bacterium]
TTRANRHVVLHSGSLNASLYSIIDDNMGDLVTQRIEIRSASVLAGRIIERNGTKSPPNVDAIQVWSFNQLTENTNLIAGKYPSHLPALTGPTALLDPQPVEAAIAASVAERQGIEIGDLLYDPLNRYEFHIVGILEAVDLPGDFWWNDPTPFTVGIVPINSDEDFLTLPLHIPQVSAREFFPDHTLVWRLVIDQTALNPESADAVESGIVNLQAQLRKNEVSLESGLPKIIQDYRVQLTIARIVLLLLISQAFIFVLYTLGMIVTFLLERSQSELATLASRGANRRQILTMFTLESGLLAIPAGVLFGPTFAQFGLQLWASASGAVIPASIPAESFLYAIAAAGIGWLALVLPVIPAAGRTVLEWQQTRARPQRQTAWQRRYLDIFLLVLGGLAYWQLVQRGSFVTQRLADATLADPLLLIGPSLLLIAITLASLRILPHLMRRIAGAVQNVRGLILPMGFARLARDPVGPSRVVLLISLTAGLILFTNAFEDSLDTRQAEMARYLAGADLRISLNTLTLDDVRETPGVVAASRAYRTFIRRGDGRAIPIIALDPDTFAGVARFPSGIGGTTIAEIVTVLDVEPERNAIPAIFSPKALPPQTGLRDNASFQFQAHALNLQVRGIIDEFPTTDEMFILINVHHIDDWARLESLSIATEEAWLEVDPVRHDALAEEFALSANILADAQAQLRAFQAKAITQGSKSAFQLNAIIFGVLSVTGFLLVHYFAARQRTLEFSILRSSGLSSAQLLALLATEGVLVVGLGLFSGTLVGVALTQMMRPFLSRVFSSVLAGATVNRILIDWGEIGGMYMMLTAFYGLAILLLLAALMRVGVHRALRVSEE